MLSPKKPLHYKPIGALDFNSSSDTNQDLKVGYKTVCTTLSHFCNMSAVVSSG